VFAAQYDFGPHAIGQHCRNPDTAIILHEVILSAHSTILCLLSSNIEKHSTLSFAGHLLVTDRIAPAVVIEAATVHYHGGLNTPGSADVIASVAKQAR
jgi:hypothetical protein